MQDGKIENADVVLDEQENWCAVLEDLDNVITLGFYTKPSGYPIQVDEIFDIIYDYEDKINSYGVEVLSDDCFCGVYLDELPKEKWQGLKPIIIDFLSAFYSENKDSFRDSVEAELNDYDEL